MSKREAGRLGGLAVLRVHGIDHMRRIGLAGARAMWRKYRLAPWGTSGYALVRREDDRIIRLFHMPDYRQLR